MNLSSRVGRRSPVRQVCRVVALALGVAAIPAARAADPLESLQGTWLFDEMAIYDCGGSIHVTGTVEILRPRAAGAYDAKLAVQAVHRDNPRCNWRFRCGTYRLDGPVVVTEAKGRLTIPFARPVGCGGPYQMSYGRVGVHVLGSAYSLPDPNLSALAILGRTDYPRTAAADAGARVQLIPEGTAGATAYTAAMAPMAKPKPKVKPACAPTDVLQGKAGCK